MMVTRSTVLYTESKANRDGDGNVGPMEPMRQEGLGSILFVDADLLSTPTTRNVCIFTSKTENRPSSVEI
jgi:hypothetical protein